MRSLLMLATVLIASAVHADELRDLCVDRPGLATPACTIDAGHAIFELGLTNWTLDRQPDLRSDTVILGNFLVRFGLDDTTEALVGWGGYGHARSRDYASGVVSQSSGIGDVALDLKKSVSGVNGPVAVQGFVTVPTGKDAIGAGDWGAGILVPVDIDLGKHVSIELTPEVDAAVDKDRTGRHLAFGSVVGISLPVTKKLNASAELSVFRDNDPGGHSTSSLTSLSFGYQTDPNTQIDVGAVAGLDSASPELQLYLGISRRF